MNNYRGTLQRYYGPGYNNDEISQRFLELEQEPTPINISDEKISLLCHVMSRHGCITFESCEGHKEQFPMVFFFPKKDTNSLMIFSHILRSYSYEKHFEWQIVVYGNPNAGIELCYILEPANQKSINLTEDYDKLMMDLDIIALSISYYWD
jgi:hypothetical protein